jgi:acyl-CoA dehydrogenase
MELSELLEPFNQMLESLFSPASIRAIEGGASASGIWSQIENSGFLDALTPEQYGGAGLDLAVVGPLWQALGRHAAPLPVAETMAARAILAEAGIPVPSGPIAISAISGTPVTGTTISFGRVAAHFLVNTPDGIGLFAAEDCDVQETGVRGDLSAHIRIPDHGHHPLIPSSRHDLEAVTALIRASLIAGAGARLLEITVNFANERVQFGKAIGRQQILQQNLAVMAEDVVSTRIAVEMACASAFPPGLVQAATAKSIASAAAPRIANMAHAVHGAIGISEEYDLQLLSRRLHIWRLLDGSESYWNHRLGAIRLESNANSVDWARMLMT